MRIEPILLLSVLSPKAVYHMSREELVNALSRIDMCQLLTFVRENGGELPSELREAVYQVAAERLFKEACAYDILAELDDQAGAQLAKTRTYIDRRVMPEVFAGHTR